MSKYELKQYDDVPMVSPGPYEAETAGGEDDHWYFVVAMAVTEPPEQAA